MPQLQRIRAGRWLYLVAAAVFVAGALLLSLRIVSLNSDLATTIHVIAPGRADMTLAYPGTYIINYEYRTTRQGRKFNTPAQFPPMDLALASSGSGTGVSIHGSPGNLTYRVGGTRGKTVAEFNIERPGAYTLTSQYRSGETGPDIALAIGRGAPGDLTVTILEIVGASFLLLIGLLIGLTTLVVRHNAVGQTPPDRVRGGIA